MANPLPVLAVLTASCLVLLVHRWREAVFLAGALTLELTVFLAANMLTDRARPNVPRLDSTPSTGSFPSGHVAATLARAYRGMHHVTDVVAGAALGVASLMVAAFAVRVVSAVVTLRDEPTYRSTTPEVAS